ncbi:hypothetical protein PPMP20_29015 [Paraburkholderia phymatum]|uniref:hypothetical protein n=1 Tax=Paraburkholderia phymatum TaxID=148447 RepID=UPI0005A04E51|nr:hypothetical protein [Paraburkholderia phymatum]
MDAFLARGMPIFHPSYIVDFYRFFRGEECGQAASSEPSEFGEPARLRIQPFAGIAASLFGEETRWDGQVATAIDAFLSRTLDQQWVLLEWLHRIEDDEHAPRLSANGGIVAIPRSAIQSENNALHDLAHVRALILEEIDLHHSGIAIVKSSGLFETKFVCEVILTQKSLMSEWLSLHKPALQVRPNNECHAYLNNARRHQPQQ